MTSSSAQLFASVSGKVISENDFLELALCFKKEMFRLETLDYYNGADDLVHSFMKGAPLPTSPDDLVWYENIKTKTAAGLSANRIHIVPAQLTDYLNWEISWAYPIGAKYGERIHLVDVNEASKIARTKTEKSLITTDFVLFDDETLILLSYRANGMFENFVSMVDVRITSSAIRLKEQLLSMGTSITI